MRRAAFRWDDWLEDFLTTNSASGVELDGRLVSSVSKRSQRDLHGYWGDRVADSVHRTNVRHF